MLHMKEDNTLENKKNLVIELRTAYLALVRACCDCDGISKTDKKTLFRLKEEVSGLFIEYYMRYRQERRE